MEHVACGRGTGRGLPTPSAAAAILADALVHCRGVSQHRPRSTPTLPAGGSRWPRPTTRPVASQA